MNQVEYDVGAPLEWIAVNHFNTEHPHVHIALRGVGADRKPVHLRREYIKHGIREIAEDLCTRQLGHRTDLDAAEAERREIHERRFTSLDRIIARHGAITPEASSHLRVRTSVQPGDNTRMNSRPHHIAARLAVLENMGLAQRTGPDLWNVRTDFEGVLRAMQRTGDRQKILGGHGAVVSDERLPIEVLDFRKTSFVEGRILVHGEDEQSGRSYLMLEGTDARVHFIHYTTEIEQARSRGKLRTNSFVRLRRILADEQSALQIEDFGDAEAILKSRGQLDATARSLIKRGILPVEDGWGGWLGRYQSALRQAAMELEYPHPTLDRDKPRERSRGR